MAPRRRTEDDDDESEDRLSYLPGSGPSMPDYGYDYPPPPGFVTAFWNPYEVKHRRRTSRAQLSVLEREFETDPKPNADKRRSLAAQLNMTPRAIQVWFQNRRAKIKAIKNKIPGGRGMPKLKPGERAAARATRATSASATEYTPGSPTDDKSDDNGPSDTWVQLSPEESPMSSPGEQDFPSEKPQFTISVPPNEGQSVSGPASPSFPPPVPGPDMLAPPSAAAMLRRGSAPAPLQGIHRARYSVYNNTRPVNSNELDVTFPPASPISPPDHEVAPLRRPGPGPGLGRRPSLPDSHLRLPAHPYYPHAGAPRMQRRSGLLSPVPDVGQEQESQSQYPPLPTMLPPAPAVGSSRIYRTLPPGMGAVPAAHDLPTQLPARPPTTSTWTPQRPFTVPVAGPLPAADFSFGAPEPGHGDAFNRVMNEDPNAGDFGNQDFNHSQEFNDFGSHMWDARTRFGSMASIASDVTAVSVSSTQATSVSGGLGTATFNNTAECSPNDGFYGYPNDFQPDLRRASCPGEFLHQFSGMGVTSDSSAPVRPSPLGRSLTIAPDSRGLSMVNDAKSLRSPTFLPGQVDPTYPPPQPGQGLDQDEGQQAMVSPTGQVVSPSNQPLISPTNQGMVSPANQGMMSPSNQSMLTPSNPNQSMMSQQHLAQANLSPSQRSLVGGGFGQSAGYEGQYQNGGYAEQNGGGYPGDQNGGYSNDQNSGYPTDQGYDSQAQPYIHTPPSFETSPMMSGVPVLSTGTTMEIINLNAKDGMLFSDNGHGHGYDMLMGQEYAHVGEFNSYS
ncbi:Homeobox protein HD-10 OS=Encephalitozoon cuniculi (strain GB-M1) GN=HD-10 PE=4 SV=1 [Rhizoctonia solani AG-1 IB]|uniref:Homeobox protein HD-10 n=3 Tax=Thanatephorus cucumeris (strain AG1-IB / isolate 7/3/14) TaxID=1108050 RepID=A0A0B7FRN0_THACB|nr:Homeobox protein HD-10 OS=Encephalitozoon cuniculi (strain GB-M1) GN=HD-10 PE=4 SV=1 [Rhizoctonia solani AG-1 IB]